MTTFGRAVQGEPQLEAVRVVDLDLFQFRPQQDVFLRLRRGREAQRQPLLRNRTGKTTSSRVPGGTDLVGKQQVTDRLVLRILHHGCDELQHGSDPCEKQRGDAHFTHKRRACVQRVIL